MSDSFYDVVVIGTELTGLVAAAMLAKRNYRVLVVGHGPAMNDFVIDGIRYARRPWLFGGFETSGLIKRAFTELALSLEMQNRPKPFDPFFQVVMPGRRIDATGKEAVFQRELEREFPGELERIQHFYRAVREANNRISSLVDPLPVLPPDGFFETRAWKKTVSAALESGVGDPLSLFPEGHPFRAFALAPLMFSSGCHPSSYSPIQLARLQSHLGRGLFDIEGGIDALKRVFLDKIKSNCGDFRDRVVVDKLTMRRGKVREVVLRDRHEVIGCEMVICNTDVKRFFSLIPQEEQNERYHLRIHELQPTHLLYTTNYALKADAIPIGMARHVFVVVNPRKPLEGDNLVLLSIDTGGQQTDPNVKVLSVSARVPARNLRPTPETLAALDDRLAAVAKTVVPFFDEHLIARASAWVSVDKRTNEPFFDTTQLVPIYASTLEDTLDMTAVACRTAYKNILVAGDHLYSGLGFEGSFYGSLNALKLTMDQVSRKTLLGN